MAEGVAWANARRARSVLDLANDRAVHVLDGLGVDSLVGDVVLVDIVVLDNDGLMMVMMVVMVDLRGWGLADVVLNAVGNARHF